jgi:hypothetical protein
MHVNHIKNERMINLKFKKYKTSTIFKVTLATFILLLSFAFSAFASEFDGAFSDGGTGTVFSATANITYNSLPNIISSDTDFSTAWTALVGSSGPGICQIGWARSNLGVFPYPKGTPEVHYFFGWINNNGLYNEKYTGGGPALGSNHRYSNGSYVSNYTTYGTGCIDGTQYFSAPLDWTPKGAQFFTEVPDNLYNRLPGRISLPEVFSNVSYFQGIQTLRTLLFWADTDGGQDSSQYSTTNSFSVWDKRVQ